MRFLSFILLPLGVLLPCSKGYSMTGEEADLSKPPLSIRVPPLARESSSSSSIGSSLPAFQAEEKVLLAIEDDSTTIKMIRYTAQRKGWQVIIASSYDAAIDMYHTLEHLPFLAITSDHNLKRTPTAGPDPKKGLDFARYLRERNKKTPIIMYSATEDPTFESTCEELNIKFFRKGVTGYPTVLDHLFLLFSTEE